MKFASLALLIASTPGFSVSFESQFVPVGNNPSGTVSSLSVTGCGPSTSARLEKGDLAAGVQNQLLVLDFDDLSLSTETGISSANCFVEAQVKVPAGRRLRINAGNVFGYGDLAQASAESSGHVSFAYGFGNMADQWTASGQLPGGQLTSFSLTPDESMSEFSTCSNSDQTLILSSQLSLSIETRPGDNASIRVTGQGQGYGMGWNWGWADCFSGEFVSAYRAYNGRVYEARLSISGDSGNYISNAPFTGQLYGIKRQGNLVTGQWAALGQDGWFRFRILDMASGAFEGEWGDNTGPHPKGTWSGRRH